MKDLQRHASDVAYILNSYSSASDWLIVASGIISIEFDWNRFDPYDGAMWCRPAYEYDKSKGEVTQLYVYELTIFNYIWGALECVVSETFSKKEIKTKGKINCVTHLIKQKGYFPVLNNQSVTEEFVNLLRYRFEENKYQISSKSFKYFDKNGLNLQLIYKIRNEFAHGDIVFPDGDDYSIKNPKKFIDLITLSSRIVLFYIQALIILSETSDNIYKPYDMFFEEDPKYNFFDCQLTCDFIASRIHLEILEPTDMTMTLFGDYYYNLY